MIKINLLATWSGENKFFGKSSAQSYLKGGNFAFATGGACGSACGSGDKGDSDDKKEQKPSACGSACGAGDK